MAFQMEVLELFGEIWIGDEYHLHKRANSCISKYESSSVFYSYIC